MERIFDYEWSRGNLLGKGSYSSVYKGIYKGSDNKFINKNTIIAIKIMNIKNLSKKGMEVVNDEIKVMRIIRRDPHPNIVGCFDVFQDSDNVYIIMEYCDSGTLRTILKKPLKERYVQYYFMQLTDGLKYLDNYNILHRDIKPKNILLANNRRTIKIADFGFAKSTDKGGMSLHETMCGSPLYMAPEIIGNNSYNNQTDLWSIGMILFEMLYGYHPLNNCTSLADIKETIETETIMIPPIKNTNKTVSLECLTFLSRLLQKDAKNRMDWEEFFSHKWNSRSDRPKSENIVNATFHPTLTSNSGGEEEVDDKYESKIMSKNVEIIEDYIDSINEKNRTNNVFHMEFDP